MTEKKKRKLVIDNKLLMEHKVYTHLMALHRYIHLLYLENWNVDDQEWLSAVELARDKIGELLSLIMFKIEKCKAEFKKPEDFK